MTKTLTYTDTDKAALDAATAADIKSPSTISDTDIPDVAALHNRIQTLEALVEHICHTYFRNVDPGIVVKDWLERRAGSKVLDESVKGRA